VLLDEKLSRVFGPDTVFRSSRSIPAAAPFQPALLQAVTECSVVLAVIGPHWLTPDEHGHRRIDAPADWVRLELEIAMASGKPIIPILVGDAELPEPRDLPPTIRSLADRQYRRLHHRSAEFDLMHIVDEVRRNLPPQHGTPLPKPADSVLLTSLPVAQRSTDVRLGAADLNGRHYGDSVVYRCDLFAGDPRGLISFNLGMRFRRLETTVGVLDDATDSDQTGVFRVILDGTIKAEVTAKQGQPRVLGVDLTDGLRLQLLAYRPGTTESPLLAGARIAGGLSNHLPELAWGNPTLHP
jgi:hypothetical protein